MFFHNLTALLALICFEEFAVFDTESKSVRVVFSGVDDGGARDGAVVQHRPIPPPLGNNRQLLRRFVNNRYAIRT